jgi:hypothetical protein
MFLLFLCVFYRVEHHVVLCIIERMYRVVPISRPHPTDRSYHEMPSRQKGIVTNFRLRTLTASALCAMFSSTAYRGLCPFLYPPAARRYAFQGHHRVARGSLRALSTRTPCLKAVPAAASASAPPLSSPAASPSTASPSAAPAPAPAAPAADTPEDPDAPPSPDDPAPPAYEGPQHIRDRLAQLPLRFLDKPLGLPSPPSTGRKTWKEVMEELLDRQKRLEERRHLCVDFLALSRTRSPVPLAPGPWPMAPSAGSPFSAPPPAPSAATFAGFVEMQRA